MEVERLHLERSKFSVFERASFVFLVFFVIGCGPSDEITRYQVPAESRTVRAEVPNAPVAESDHTVMQRMIAAIIPNGDRAWFFKAMGPVEKISAIESDVRPFLNSWRFNAEGTPEWELPEGWKNVENSVSMRFATIQAKDNEASISFLGMPADDHDGYLLMNINRWRGQLGLPDAQLDQLDEIATEFDIADSLTGTLVDMTGKAAAGGPMMGPFANRPASDGTIDVRPVAGPNSSDPRTGTATNSADSNANPNGWEIPSDWKLGRQSSMRLAAYDVEQDGKKAEITVIGLVPSDFAANINRWRQQIGLPSVSPEEIDKEVTEFDVDGTPSKMIILDGGDGAQSIAAVIVPKAGRMWFVKMMGDTSVVLEQSEAFERFARSLTF